MAPNYERNSIFNRLFFRMSEQIEQRSSAIAEYKAAEARLSALREAAREGFKEAQAQGDIIAGERWRSELQRGLDDFKVLRERLPIEVQLWIKAERILESFTVSAKEIVSLVVPGDTTDREAIEALNARFRDVNPDRSGDLIEESVRHLLLGWVGEHERRKGVARSIAILPVVPGTVNMSRDQQRDVLLERGMVFAHPIEQALAAAAYACKRDGEDIFGGCCARGSVPRYAVSMTLGSGVFIEEFRNGVTHAELGVSGSVTPR